MESSEWMVRRCADLCDVVNSALKGTRESESVIALAVCLRMALQRGIVGKEKFPQISELNESLSALIEGVLDECTIDAYKIFNSQKV
jgi:hypothetical protein